MDLEEHSLRGAGDSYELYGLVHGDASKSEASKDNGPELPLLHRFVFQTLPQKGGVP